MKDSSKDYGDGCTYMVQAEASDQMWKNLEESIFPHTQELPITYKSSEAIGMPYGKTTQISGDPYASPPVAYLDEHFRSFKFLTGGEEALMDLEDAWEKSIHPGHISEGDIEDLPGVDMEEKLCKLLKSRLEQFEGSKVSPEMEKEVISAVYNLKTQILENEVPEITGGLDSSGQHNCRCPFDQLLREGCTCGGI